MARNYNWRTGCDVEATLSVIGGRWKPVLICHLLGGRKRFGELRRLVPNATERMITLQLRELEADGVIARYVFAEVPPRVEYEVTDYGRSLESILVSMQDWGRAFKARQLAREASVSEDASEHAVMLSDCNEASRVPSVSRFPDITRNSNERLDERAGSNRLTHSSRH